MANVYLLQANDHVVGAFTSKSKAEQQRDKELAILSKDDYTVVSFIKIGGQFGFRATHFDGDVIEYTIRVLELNRGTV